MVPFWDLSSHINDLTSKKNPLTACDNGNLGNSPSRIVFKQRSKQIRNHDKRTHRWNGLYNTQEDPNE